jgi:threonine aldolase
MTWKAGIDAVSFGGTKNGCLGVEAVVMFDPARGRELALRRKRAGHLWSKHRYLSAQMLAYATDGLWLEMAQRPIRRAHDWPMACGVCPARQILHEPAGNLIYAELPRAAHARAFAAGHSTTSTPETRRWTATRTRPCAAGWCATGPRPRRRWTP